jgi:penicillin-binding protein 2
MQDIFLERIRMFHGVIITFTIFFIIRLAFIQLIDDKNLEKSRNNAIKELIEYPSRGEIFDRKFRLMVHNQNLYEILVTPLEVEKGIDSAMLCSDLGIDFAYYTEIMRKARKTSVYKPYVFLKQVSAENHHRFQEHIFKYKGFYGQTRSIRAYPYSTGALLFGDISEIDSSQIKAFAAEGVNKYDYQSGDYIGKNGVELSYEKYLRGERGQTVVIVDAFNRIKGSYSNGEYDRKPKSGNDLIASIDVDLQNLGEELLTQKIGAIVAIEPSTGEVLAMCSSPTFDPNLLTGRSRNKYYPKLLLNKYKPLYNRAIQGTYPPGSTFKAITGLVSLQMGAIGPNFGYSCPGYYSIGRKSVKCSHRHPSCRNIEEGLTQSCNPYFCQVFRNAIEVPNSKRMQLDYDRWFRNIRRFGYGIKLGVDIKNEKRGNVPDTTYYNKVYNSSWRPTTVISLGIGQGEILATPLQMANSYCIIANRGYFITPHIIKRISMNGSLVVNKEYMRKITVPIAPTYYNHVIDGLESVVLRGTARSSAIDGIALCGKTGTAQNPHGEDHSLFVGFAPKDNPKIVVACIVENGGGGGGLAAPIVSLMVEKYLKGEIPSNRQGLKDRIKNRHIINFQLEDEPKPINEHKDSLVRRQ